MREIKFRGKSVDNGEWVYGGYVYDYHNNSHLIFANELGAYNAGFKPRKDDYTLNCYQVIPKTVGQFTGLKDKNGVEIYEGDIVLVNRYDLLSTSWNSEIENEKRILIMSRVGYVVYDELRLSFRVKSPICNQTIALSGVGYFDYDIEVIGNIYDNPELSEVEE